jgi:hypothetical protein
MPLDMVRAEEKPEVSGVLVLVASVYRYCLTRRVRVRDSGHGLVFAY